MYRLDSGLYAGLRSLRLGIVCRETLSDRRNIDVVHGESGPGPSRPMEVCDRATARQPAAPEHVRQPQRYSKSTEHRTRIVVLDLFSLVHGEIGRHRNTTTLGYYYYIWKHLCYQAEHQYLSSSTHR